MKTPNRYATRHLFRLADGAVVAPTYTGSYDRHFERMMISHEAKRGDNV